VRQDLNAVGASHYTPCGVYNVEAHMVRSAKKLRQFSVHARHLDDRRDRVIEESSSEAAAIAYVEDFTFPTDDIKHQLSVIVRDLVRGDEHCFTINLETGEATSCS
jgi:hypothetical protein